MQLAHHNSNDLTTSTRPLSKLLIVEDEVLFARAVMRRLQKAGYECEHVENIQDARIITKQFVPDIVLLDMRLPDGNGLDLIAELVATSAVVIVMTAHGEISDTVNAIKNGAVDYLKKPIDLDELLVSVQKAEAVAIQANRLDYSRQRMHTRPKALKCWVKVPLCIVCKHKSNASHKSPPLIPSYPPYSLAVKLVQEKILLQDCYMCCLPIKINLLYM